MNSNTYYLLAIVVSSFNVILSIINMSLIFINRSRKPSMNILIQEGVGDKRVFVIPPVDDFNSKGKIYKIAVLIKNTSSLPINIISVNVCTRKFFKIKPKRKCVRGKYPIDILPYGSVVIEIGNENLFNDVKKQYIEVIVNEKKLKKTINKDILNGIINIT